MEDLSDVFIRRSLKNWAAEEQPPAQGRARLLFLASSDTSRPGTLGQFCKNDGRPYINTNISNTMTFPTAGSFYQPLLWVLHLNLTPIRNVA